MKKYLFFLSVIPFVVVAVVFYLHKDAVEAATTIHPNDIFANFTTWRQTGNQSPHPLLDSLASYNETLYDSTPNKFTFTDINGDNLPDFLYHEKAGDTTAYTVGTKFLAIFFNNGNNNFNLAYKCVVRFNNPGYTSFGDCGGAQITDPNDPANQNMLANVLTLANYATGTSTDPIPRTHLWIDINGDGLQDYIDTSLHINNNQTSPYPLQF